jgi:hypothetical protein
MPIHACGCKCAPEGTSSEADLARGRWGPSSEGDHAQGRCGPSSEADLIRGGLSPRARRTSLEGALWWATVVATTWIALSVCFALSPRLDLYFTFFAGFKQDSPVF